MTQWIVSAGVALQKSQEFVMWLLISGSNRVRPLQHRKGRLSAKPSKMTGIARSVLCQARRGSTAISQDSSRRSMIPSLQRL